MASCENRWSSELNHRIWQVWHPARASVGWGQAWTWRVIQAILVVWGHGWESPPEWRKFGTKPNVLPQSSNQVIPTSSPGAGWVQENGQKGNIVSYCWSTLEPEYEIRNGAEFPSLAPLCPSALPYEYVHVFTFLHLQDSQPCSTPHCVSLKTSTIKVTSNLSSAWLLSPWNSVVFMGKPSESRWSFVKGQSDHVPHMLEPFPALPSQ